MEFSLPKQTAARVETNDHQRCPTCQTRTEAFPPIASPKLPILQFRSLRYTTLYRTGERKGRVLKSCKAASFLHLWLQALDDLLRLTELCLVGILSKLQILRSTVYMEACKIYQMDRPCGSIDSIVLLSITLSLPPSITKNTHNLPSQPSKFLLGSLWSHSPEFEYS